MQFQKCQGEREREREREREMRATLLAFACRKWKFWMIMVARINIKNARLYIGTISLFNGLQPME
jgi:hypothetical protein